MRIGVINLRGGALYFPANRSDFGGAEVESFLLASLFHELGHEVHVLLEAAPTADFRTTEGLHVHGLNCRGTSPMRRRVALWRRLSRLNPDLCFSKNVTEHTAIVGLWCRLYRKRFVYRAANQRDIDLAQGGHRHGWRQSLYHVLTMAGATRIVAQTAAQEQAFQRRFGVDRVSLIPNFIDGAQRADLPFRERARILWVGHLTAVKGPERVLELAARLPDLPFRMIATAADTPFSRSLRARIPSRPNVELVENVPYPEMQGHFDRARVLLNTSRSEGFPNAFLQAMRAGLPLATSGLDPGGLIEAGLGVAEADPERLAAALGRLHDDEQAWRAFHDVVARHFNLHHSQDMYARRYREVLEA